MFLWIVVIPIKMANLGMPTQEVLHALLTVALTQLFTWEFQGMQVTKVTSVRTNVIGLSWLVVMAINHQLPSVLVAVVAHGNSVMP